MSHSATRVLLIDDEAELRVMLATMLRTLGMVVDDFEDAESALSHARSLEAAPQLVVSDVGLPGMDGPTLIRALEALHPGTAARALLITGDDLGPGLTELTDQFGTGVLGKPFRMDEFVRRCREHLPDEPR